MTDEKRAKAPAIFGFELAHPKSFGSCASGKKLSEIPSIFKRLIAFEKNKVAIRIKGLLSN